MKVFPARRILEADNQKGTLELDTVPPEIQHQLAFQQEKTHGTRNNSQPKAVERKAALEMQRSVFQVRATYANVINAISRINVTLLSLFTRKI